MCGAITIAAMLSHILESSDYALCLSPGFFRFYAHIGILHALEESNLLKAKYVTGSSAGALVGAFLAAGTSQASRCNQN